MHKFPAALTMSADDGKAIPTTPVDDSKYSFADIAALFEPAQPQVRPPVAVVPPRDHLLVLNEYLIALARNPIAFPPAQLQILTAISGAVIELNKTRPIVATAIEQCTCAVCKDITAVPKLLGDCGHTICQNCLERIDDTTKAKCVEEKAPLPEQQFFADRHCPLCKTQIVGPAFRNFSLKAIAESVITSGIGPAAQLFSPRRTKYNDSSVDAYREAFMLNSFSQAKMAPLAASSLLTQLTQEQCLHGVRINFPPGTSKVFFEAFTAALNKVPGLSMQFSHDARAILIQLNKHAHHQCLLTEQNLVKIQILAAAYAKHKAIDAKDIQPIQPHPKFTADAKTSTDVLVARAEAAANLALVCFYPIAPGETAKHSIPDKTVVDPQVRIDKLYKITASILQTLDKKCGDAKLSVVKPYPVSVIAVDAFGKMQIPMIQVTKNSTANVITTGVPGAAAAAAVAVAPAIPQVGDHKTTPARATPTAAPTPPTTSEAKRTSTKPFRAYIAPQYQDYALWISSKIDACQAESNARKDLKFFENLYEMMLFHADLKSVHSERVPNVFETPVDAREHFNIIRDIFSEQSMLQNDMTTDLALGRVSQPELLSVMQKLSQIRTDVAMYQFAWKIADDICEAQDKAPDSQVACAAIGRHLVRIQRLREANAMPKFIAETIVDTAQKIARALQQHHDPATAVSKETKSESHGVQDSKATPFLMTSEGLTRYVRDVANLEVNTQRDYTTNDIFNKLSDSAVRTPELDSDAAQRKKDMVIQDEIILFCQRALKFANEYVAIHGLKIDLARIFQTKAAAPTPSAAPIATVLGQTFVGNLSGNAVAAPGQARAVVSETPAPAAATNRQ